MTDRPILFSAPMVRALLDGRKTQTRRIAKPRSKVRPSLLDDDWTDNYVLDPGNAEWLARDVPFAVGDRLWVKETWRANYGLDLFNENLDRCPRPTDMDPKTTAVEYLADGERELGGKTRVSIHMPRWASRLTLLVTEVRVERLQNCSDADAIAEGIEQHGRFFGLPDTDWDDAELTASAAYRRLWDSINGAGSWAANPWVVAVTFDVERRNIDG